MRFAFEDHQIAVRDTVGALLDKRCDTGLLEQCWSSGGAGPAMPVWKELASLGVQGLLAPEQSGGSGLDGLTMGLVLAECGRYALPLPVVETAAVAVPLLASAGDTSGVLASLLDGSGVVTLATGRSRHAPASSTASHFLIASNGDATLYPRDEVQIEPVQSVDRMRDLAAINPRGRGVRVGPSAAADELAALGSAAVLLGLGRALVDTTVAYVKDRKQFGVPVGSFQAVKHHLADAHLRMEFAAPVVWAASHSGYPGGPGGAERVRLISMAKAMASDAASFAARVALQCHGAMGYTDDYPLHMWLKRVWCLAAAHGSAAEHRSLVATELGI
ncbi:MAG TPA: acyl-CoA dehydrogenase family protein [Acidimicrobiales bacterium]|nr:acyl-CoA dehydrogenase family protein [Acidimicrobiales bacterium]